LSSSKLGVSREKLAKAQVRHNIWVSQTQTGDFGAASPGITVFAVQAARE